jgi:hypothetical protein
MTESATPSEPAVVNYVYSSILGLTRGLKFLVGFGILLNGFDIVFRTLEYRLLERIDLGDFGSAEEQIAAAEASDARVQGLAVVSVILFFVILISMLVWVYRANRNARALGATGLESTPGLAVGWFFIPFANLVMPYRALQEIWRASGDSADWKTSPRLHAVGWWWGLWLTSALMAQAIVVMAKNIDSVAEAKQASLGFMAQTGIETLAYVALLVMVTRIAARQEQKHSVPNVF